MITLTCFFENSIHAPESRTEKPSHSFTPYHPEANQEHYLRHFVSSLFDFWGNEREDVDLLSDK